MSAPPPLGVLNPSYRATVHIVWRRELLRLQRSRGRVLINLLSPVLFLFVLGAGLGTIIEPVGGIDFRQFVLPGAVAISVATSALAGASSIVWDREFGFLREMLVAPVRRDALVLGKAAGVATVAVGQGLVMLLLSPAVGLGLTPRVFVQVLLIAVVMAFALTAFGMVLANLVERIETFHIILQFVMTPMLFLSGALFPLDELPGWLTVLTRLNPLTYAVDAMRQVILGNQQAGAAATERFAGGLDLFGHRLSVVEEVGMLALMTAGFLILTLRRFGRPE